MTPSQRHQLDETGYLVLPDFMTPEILGTLRRRTEELYEQEGENAGSEFRMEAGSRRLANLVAKGEIFERIISMPEILECVTAVIGPDFKLSSLNARSANPQSMESQQPLHADMGAIPDGRGYWVCNTLWMLDDLTPENGALRAVPGSHRWRKLPQTELPDLRATHPQEVLVTGKAGTVVIVNAHMWHGGTANRTDNHRRAVHGFYVRSDKPQQQYQRALIPEPLQRRFSASLRRILALDDPLNDELSSAVDKPSGFLK
jgi:ectoine hydroxylase-related dioxygenase (phytanoyl-CoA dioxygenase family)